VYADNEKKQMMYGEFENWLNMYGKNITVRKSNTTLHSVLARWTSKDDDKSRKTVESKCVCVCVSGLRLQMGYCNA
jgi:hypothetical protein